MDFDLKKLIKDGALELGLDLPPEIVESFSVYLRELKAWGGKMNLTAITTDRDVIIKHFLDSLTLCAFLKNGGQESLRLLDIGSGAGFPGIPVKLVMPGLNPLRGLEVVMMDCVTKKVHFMRHVIRVLGLQGIDAISARVEDKAVIEKYAGRFDVVSSRAFAGLGAFVTAALPYCRDNGIIIAMKGPAVANELKELDDIKGISAPEIFEVKVPFSDRFMVMVRLTKHGNDA